MKWGCLLESGHIKLSQECHRNYSAMYTRYCFLHIPLILYWRLVSLNGAKAYVGMRYSYVLALQLWWLLKLLVTLFRTMTRIWSGRWELIWAIIASSATMCRGRRRGRGKEGDRRRVDGVREKLYINFHWMHRTIINGCLKYSRLIFIETTCLAADTPLSVRAHLWNCSYINIESNNITH